MIHERGRSEVRKKFAKELAKGFTMWIRKESRQGFVHGVRRRTSNVASPKDLQKEFRNMDLRRDSQKDSQEDSQNILEKARKGIRWRSRKKIRRYIRESERESHKDSKQELERKIQESGGAWVSEG